MILLPTSKYLSVNLKPVVSLTCAYVCRNIRTVKTQFYNRPGILAFYDSLKSCALYPESKIFVDGAFLKL